MYIYFGCACYSLHTVCNTKLHAKLELLCVTHIKREGEREKVFQRSNMYIHTIQFCMNIYIYILCTTIIIYSILLVWLKGMRIIAFTKRKSADCPAKSKSQCKQDHPHERTCVRSQHSCVQEGKKHRPQQYLGKFVRYTRAHTLILTYTPTLTNTLKHTCTLTPHMYI